MLGGALTSFQLETTSQQQEGKLLAFKTKTALALSAVTIQSLKQCHKDNALFPGSGLPCMALFSD